MQAVIITELLPFGSLHLGAVEVEVDGAENNDDPTEHCGSDEQVQPGRHGVLPVRVG